MQHVMGYLAFSALALLLAATPGSAAAMDGEESPQPAQADASPADVRPISMRVGGEAAGAAGNLDPARGPVVSNPHAYPHDLLGSSTVPRHTWPGYSMK